MESVFTIQQVFKDLTPLGSLSAGGEGEFKIEGLAPLLNPLYRLLLISVDFHPLRRYT
jgi:hypothetical protein